MPEMSLRTAETSLGRSPGGWARAGKWSKPPTDWPILRRAEAEAESRIFWGKVGTVSLDTTNVFLKVSFPKWAGLLQGNPLG